MAANPMYQKWGWKHLTDAHGNICCIPVLRGGESCIDKQIIKCQAGNSGEENIINSQQNNNKFMAFFTLQEQEYFPRVIFNLTGSIITYFVGRMLPPYMALCVCMLCPKQSMGIEEYRVVRRS